jgi:uncharacterized membrane protein
LKLKIKKFIARNYLFLIILGLGLFLKSYKPLQLFIYSHDQDLAGWMIKDVLVNKHLRLIGQETSTQGVFIGPLFYYLLIPFYLLFNMDPAGGVLMVTLLGAFSIWSFYFVFLKIFEKSTGLIASLIYATSFYTVFTDREVVPTTPVIVWTVWFLYSLHLILKGEQKKGFILGGILLGLAWNFNLALAIIAPLALIAFFLGRKKLNINAAILGMTSLILTSLPLIFFELRHGFSQVRAVLESLAPGQGGFSGILTQFHRAITLISKNTTGLLWGSFINIEHKWALYILIGLLLFLGIKKLIKKELAILWSVWLVIYIVFFSLNPIILSEYYFNGMTVIWIGIASVTISSLFNKKRFRKLSISLIVLFLAINIYRFFSIGIVKMGYIEKKQLVAYIKEDALAHNYPCVAVSYITKPGYDFGYRYFFWQEEMHVNNPDSESPVYTIVFPHRLVDRIDKSFGALGLILPDYEKYTEEEIEISCSGKNSNLTNPMFGYTE